MCIIQYNNHHFLRLEATQRCDVLVLGAGIAGISAALSASELGAKVILACKGKLFSGSSFYPGTWGLGLIGPENSADEEDLEETIKTVGCGMAQDDLVKSLVSGIRPAIDRVEKMGVRLKKAQSGADQREYIPCFDHKHRDWNGIEFQSARQVFGEKLKSSYVTVLAGWEAIELAKQKERIRGAVLSNGVELQYISAKSVVLATGGYGSLFQHHLCTLDVEGMGQGLALDVGCQLVNMEFMQIMPGYLSPAYGTVFNEKVFHFTELKADGVRILSNQSELLEIRSGHGPFTSRLSSKAVDLAIDGQSNGVTVHYSDALRENPPEFVKTYFNWLQQEKGLTMDDSIQIGLFAHAANGGIFIHTDASTGVPGLFAAGEVTGGMHGADRIGGLSTANGLVFGTKAGASAALDAASAPESPSVWTFLMMGVADCLPSFRTLQHLMTENAMAVRRKEGLQKALNNVRMLSQNMCLKYTESVSEITATRRLQGQLQTAIAILLAEQLRTESRGSHYREDFPAENPDLCYRILAQKTNDGIQVKFEYNNI